MNKRRASKNSYRPAKASRQEDAAPKTRAPVGSEAAASRGHGTHWGNVAEWYDELVGDDGTEFHREVILPGIVRMLQRNDREAAVPESRKARTKEALPPLHVLDLACGQGVVSRHLAAAGATVLGIDAAAPLVEAARTRNEQDHLPVRYEVADATRLIREDGTPLPPLEPEGFDAVTLVLAIQNITPLSPVWHACRTVLKPGGVLIVVMMHPAFRIPKAADWHWDAAGDKATVGGGGRQGRVVYQYLSSSRIEIQTHPGLAAHGKSASTTPHFHRPLQAYINTLGNAGLPIDHLEEWTSHKTSEPGPRKAALDKARQEIPMFLALRARKC